MFDFLINFLSGSAWTYLIVLAIVAIDAFFPVVPGETAIITAAILAANGELSIAIVVLAAWIGAMGGDNVSRLLGKELGSRAARFLFRSQKARARLDWARRQVSEHGWTMVAAGRFIPGGRTAATFASGMLDMRWRRFMSADLPATLFWTLLTAGLGYLGGEAFQHSVWKPLLISLGISALLIGGVELVRRWRQRSGGSGGSDGVDSSRAAGKAG